MKYELLENGDVRRTSDGAIIPPVVSNMDYKDYLRWVETGIDQPEPVVEL